MMRTAVLAAAFFTAAASHATLYTFTADLSGSQEVPSTSTSASGFGTFQIDTGNGADSDWTISRGAVLASGLSGPVTNATIDIGAVGLNGPTLYTLGAPQSNAGGFYLNSLSGTVGPKDDFSFLDRNGFLAVLQSGNAYFNLDTAGSPNGEVRGQIHYAGAAPVPEPASFGVMGVGLIALVRRRRRKV